MEEEQGRQMKKLKTSITFHFLNLKQITVCGIHWSWRVFGFVVICFSSFAKPIDSTSN